MLVTRNKPTPEKLEEVWKPGITDLPGNSGCYYGAGIDIDSSPTGGVEHFSRVICYGSKEEAEGLRDYILQAVQFYIANGPK